MQQLKNGGGWGGERDIQQSIGRKAESCNREFGKLTDIAPRYTKKIEKRKKHTYSNLMVFLVKMPLCWSLVTVTSMAGLTCMMENGYMVMLGRITAMETTVLGSATTTVHSVVFKSANIYWNSIVLNTYICIHKHCILNSVFLSKSTTNKHQDVMFKAFTACWILKPQLWTLCSITNASSFPHFCVSVCPLSFCHRVSHPSFFPCMLMSPNLFSICVYVSRRSFYLRLYFHLPF